MSSDEFQALVLKRLDRIEEVVIALAKVEERQVHNNETSRAMRIDVDDLQERLQSVETGLAVIKETAQSTHRAAWLIFGTVLSAVLTWVVGLI